MVKFSVFLIILCFFSSSFADTLIRLNPNKIIGHVSPLILGTCIEDVNHEIYGGIYSQRIFGESFEEAPEIKRIKGFTPLKGEWKKDGSSLYVYNTPLAYLIHNEKNFRSGWVEVEIRYDGLSGQAGILLNALEENSALQSAYEIMLSAWNRKLLIKKMESGKSKEIVSSSISFEPNALWHTLRVAYLNNKITVSLNGQTITCFTDATPLKKSGTVGIIAQDADVAFKEFKIYSENNLLSLPFECVTKGVSAMWTGFYEGTQPHFRHITRDSFTGNASQLIANKEGNGCVGVANEGLNHWGIAIHKGGVMEGKLALKGKVSEVVIALQSYDGKTEYARQILTGITPEWTEMEFSLKPNTSDPRSRLVIMLEKEGTLQIDQVFMQERNTGKYGSVPIRADIADGLVNEGIKLIRYGGSMVNSPEYRIANMLGNRQHRSPYRGNWYKHSSNGFGIIEFVQMSETLQLEPVFAINIDDNPEDVAHLIAYLNAPISNPWGALRASDGHPKPYGVKYIELGNEEVIQQDDTEAYKHYIQRFLILTEAMKKEDNQLQFIIGAWWRKNSPNCKMVFNALHKHAAFWDYHPGVDDDQFIAPKKVQNNLVTMQNRFKQWNPHTKLKCVILEENGNSHAIKRMLCHAITYNAVLRNSNFVMTTCQANALEPYLQNDNGWNQGQIFFTPSQVWHQPTSYAVQMASKHYMPLAIETIVPSNNHIDVATTMTEDKRNLAIHIVNTSKEPQDISIDLSTFGHPNKSTATLLYGSLEDKNTPLEPTRVVSREKKIAKNGKVQLPPYSYTIVKYTL